MFFQIQLNTTFTIIYNCEYIDLKKYQNLKVSDWICSWRYFYCSQLRFYNVYIIYCNVIYCFL